MPAESHLRVAPRLGESQRRILELLKRRGAGTVPAMAGDLGLNVETVRTHVNALRSEGLVRRTGRRGHGRGRPEIVYGLAETAAGLFPNREGEVLLDLIRFLREEGREALAEGFFEERLARRLPAARVRMEGLEGEARWEEVARILSEAGFMAEVEREGAAPPVLRLCHCPLRGLVGVSRAVRW